MSSLTINPNKQRDAVKQEIAALERDQAAIHHYDNDARAPAPAQDQASQDVRSVQASPPSPPAPAKPAPPPLAAIAPIIPHHQAEIRASPPIAPAPPATPAPPAAAAGSAMCGALHPLVGDLFAMLPPAGGQWSCEERLYWLSAAESAFHLVYRTSGRIRIEQDE